MDGEDSRYALAESRFRWLAGTAAFRTKLFTGAFFGLLAVNAVAFFWVTRLLAEMKAQGREVYVLALDEHGNRLNVPVVKAADWDGPNTGMIVDQLRQSVTCVRGLSTDTREVNACWEKELGARGHAGKFVERAAAMLSEYADKEFAPTSDALAERVSKESVQIQHMGVTHPDDDRWALQWRERVIDRSGRVKTESVWTGTFTVRVVPLTQVDVERNNTGLQIVYYDWSKDPNR